MIPGVKLQPGVRYDWISDPGPCALTDAVAASRTPNAARRDGRTWLFMFMPRFNEPSLRDDDGVPRLNVNRLPDALDRVVIVELQRGRAGGALPLNHDVFLFREVFEPASHCQRLHHRHLALQRQRSR